MKQAGPASPIRWTAARRIARLLRHILAGVVLIAWITIVVFWIRSYFRGDYFGIDANRLVPQQLISPPRRNIWLFLISGRGGIALAMRHEQSLPVMNFEPTWQVSREPIYPCPWLGQARMTLTLTSHSLQDGIAPVAMPDGWSVSDGTFTIDSSATSKPASTIVQLPYGRFVPYASPGSAVQQSIDIPSPRQRAMEQTAAPDMLERTSRRTEVGRTTSFVDVHVPPGSVATLGTLSFAGSLVAPPTILPRKDYRFFAYSVTWNGHDQSRVIILPYWAPALLISLLLTWLGVNEFRFIRGRWWKRRGLCPTCGYDLRATPDRCPECGTVVQAHP